MAKPLHAGLAASAGILAALLAEEGFSAGEAVLEGERGLFDLVAGPGRWDGAAGLRVLNHEFALAVEGLGIKRFASCGVTHSPIEAVLRLRDKHGIRHEGVVALELVVNPLAVQIARHADPANGLESKFSLPHCLAVALLTGGAGLSQFTDDRAADEVVARVRDRVRITTDPEVGLEGHMSFGCRLVARLADGSELATEITMARGKWVGERLTHVELVDKFNGCAEAGGVSAGSGDDCRALIEMLYELGDLRELAGALHRAGAGD
jgi:2-methylcitrate dehydratase PrpD